MKLSDSEWAVMEALWDSPRRNLSSLTLALAPKKGWSKNTVHTYLTRMEKKGLVSIDHGDAQPYTAAISREDCARSERNELLGRVYGGAAGELIAAFLKESSISAEEVERLRRLLDEMEV